MIPLAFKVLVSRFHINFHFKLLKLPFSHFPSQVSHLKGTTPKNDEIQAEGNLRPNVTETPFLSTTGAISV